MSFLTGTSSKTTTEPVYLQSSLSGGQQSIQDWLASALTGTNIGSIVNSLYPQYQGAVAAPVSTATQQAVEAGTGAIPGEQAAASGVGGVESGALTALQSALTSQPTSLADYYTSSIYGPAESTLTETTLPGIMSGAGGSVGGYQSTSETYNVDQAIKDMYSSIGSTLGQTGVTTGQQNITNQLNALSNLSSVSGAPLSTIGSIMSQGLTGQSDLQAMLTAQQQPYNQQQTNTTNWLNNILSYLDTQTLTPAVQYGTSGGSSGLLSGIFQGLSSPGSSGTSGTGGSGSPSALTAFGNWLGSAFNSKSS